MARFAYVNGRYVDHRLASVHIEDRGYQLADGVYEVVGVRDGKLIDETLHIDRLDRSLKELRIGWPVARATLGFIMRELMRRNHLRDGLVYMQVTRGVARRDHGFPTTPVKPAMMAVQRVRPTRSRSSMAANRVMNSGVARLMAVALPIGR